ncbi:MAG: hypothetical protein A2711_15075 [Burkholderiales bacterium RIFCSPHIGHO2_01_FULL_63_240]|nr:MAG: hypothetical protein A2711_15075 [Burkholderiales bacterium RIFCSPHIGHO2_01_FULL_63_240]
MNALRRHRQTFSWIAIVAILMLLLAPTLVRAWHADTPARLTLTEVCSAQGTRWVSVSTDAPADQPAAEHSAQHCPWCAHHAPTLGLPPAGLDMSWLRETTHALPRAFLHAPRTLHAWRGTQPRAPPRLS